MPENEVDLAALFEAAAKALKSNQSALNKADSYNHDHGDNMVKNFNVITRALKKRAGSTPSEQLSFASDALRKSSITGSARMYAQGLDTAATRLQGERSINPSNAMTLIQSLLGGANIEDETPAESPHTQRPSQSPQATDLLGSLIGAAMAGGQGQPQGSNQAPDMLSSLLGSIAGASSAGAPAPKPQTEAQTGDMLSSLMGALSGGATSGTTPAQPTQTGTTDMLAGLMGSLLGSTGDSASTGSAGSSPQDDILGTLMSSLLGGGQNQGAGGGLNASDLLRLAMAYMQAKQQGAPPMQAVIQALMSGSQMNNTPHHSQSGQLVATTLINALGSMLKQ